jgi:hypothetical protein
MPPVPISPIDAISPAIERTKQLLLRPFNGGRWWRVGVLGLATGELLSGGGCNFPSNWHDKTSTTGGTISGIPGISAAQTAAIVTVLVAGVLALVLVHLYISSVLRFVLFSGTINGNYHIRQGWKHWHSRGLRYFGFQLALLALMALLFLPIALAMWKAFSLSKGNIGAVIASVLVFVPLALLVTLIAGIFHVFLKDFCVVLIALEDLPVLESIRRVWRMVRSEAGNYAGYLLTKILLVVVVGIAMFFVQMILLLVLLVPVVIIAVAVGVSVPHIMQNPIVLAGAVVAVLVLVFAMLVLFAVIAAPVAAFYQSYVLEFFGSRYEPLWALLHPAPVVAPTPPAAPPNPPFETPPIPIG